MTVDITFSAAGNPAVTKSFDLLVVACDPTALAPHTTFTQAETDVFSKFKRYAFHTTLATIKRTAEPEYGVVFSPGDNEAMAGHIYAYRNETAKQFGLDVARTLDENLYTIYQLGGEIAPSGQPWTAQDFETIFQQTIDGLPWWHHGTVQVHKTMFTPYFDHFDTTDIAAETPWDYLALQGTAKTLYVHASTCFESALHCWAYIRDLMTTQPQGVAALPANKATAQIAIVGAGVSGILAANRLVRLGYPAANIQILEKTDRFGGKTHTQYVEGPATKGGDPLTVCEMGTCYLSPSYTPMVEDLKKYVGGNVQLDFAARQENFRGIALPVKRQGPYAFKVIPYNQYVVQEAAHILGWNFTTPKEKADVYEEIGVLLLKYIISHKIYFGTDLPMPMTPPTQFLQDYGDKTFAEYLAAEGLAALRPMMEYMYEVQGYGSLDDIPAFYGLIWVTPPVIEGIALSVAENENYAKIIEDMLGLSEIKVVTAWTQGWEQLWAQIVAIDGLQDQIVYNADISNIQRH